MALAHLAFILLMLGMFEENVANKTVLNIKPILDPRSRSNIVDEAFLEQKDILLDMLEIKLKEVRDKKKKKTEEADNNRSHIYALKRDNCANLLKNVDVKYKISGLSAVGEANVILSYGKMGKSVVKVNATGISNIGQANVEVGVGDSAVYVPGLSNLFVDRLLLDCIQNNQNVPRSTEPNITKGNTDKSIKTCMNTSSNEEKAISDKLKPSPNAFHFASTETFVSSTPPNPALEIKSVANNSSPYSVKTAVVKPQLQSVPAIGINNTGAQASQV